MSKFDLSFRIKFLNRKEWGLIFIIGVGLIGGSWLVAKQPPEDLFWIEMIGGIILTFLVILNLVLIFSEKERIQTKVESQSEELTEEKLRREAIFNKSFQFIGLLEPDGTLIETNEASLGFVNLKEEDVLGKKMWNTAWFEEVEDSQKKVKEAIQKAKKGELSRFDLKISNPETEEEEWVDFSVKPVYGDGSEIKFLISEGRIITQRKRFEQDLNIKNQALESVREGVVITDPNKENNPIVYVNKGFTEITGYSLEEVRGKNCRFLQEDDRNQEGINKVKKCIENEESCEVTLRNYTKEGEMFWNSLSVAPVFDEEDQLVRFVGIQRDVTQQIKNQKRLEDQLKEIKKLNLDLERERAKDEAILDSIGESLIVTNSEGVLQFVNDAFEDTMGWSQSEVIGKNASEVLTFLDEDKERISFEEYLLSNSLEGEETIQSDTGYYLATKGGTLFPISITISPIKLKEEVIGAVGVFRDMTKVEELNKAKSEFVSLASHQLRTPLTTINWYAEMLVNEELGDLNEKQLKFVKEISKGSNRMVELVNALLNVSRIESGSMIVDREDVDLFEVSDRVLNEFKIKIKDKDLEVVKDYDEDTPVIPADSRITFIIFENLISNAVKYTPEGGRIEVSIYPNEAEEKVYIEVSDTGYGIPEEVQDKVFTKMFRADNVKTKETQGTGLGLYLVRSILNKVGGEIWFESERGEGTTFYVTLPFSGMHKKEGSKSLVFGALAENERESMVD